eukprot:scaffold11564_cov180-Ochromonas_danica.AAC.6
MMKKIHYLVVFFQTLLSATLLTSSPITVPLTPDGALEDLIPDFLRGYNYQPGKIYHIPRHKHLPRYTPSTTTSSTSNTSHGNNNSEGGGEGGGSEVNPLENVKILELKDTLSCNIDFHLEWHTTVDQPIYTPPVTFYSYASSSSSTSSSSSSSGSHDHKSIFFNSLFNTIELIEGHDGHRPIGWPISFGQLNRFYSSPLIYDIDGDGQNDIGALDYNGNLYFIRVGEVGEYLEDYHIALPRLRVRKDWIALSENVREEDGHRYGAAYHLISFFNQIEVDASILQKNENNKGNKGNNKDDVNANAGANVHQQEAKLDPLTSTKTSKSNNNNNNYDNIDNNRRRRGSGSGSGNDDLPSQRRRLSEEEEEEEEDHHLLLVNHGEEEEGHSTQGQGQGEGEGEDGYVTEGYEGPDEPFSEEGMHYAYGYGAAGRVHGATDDHLLYYMERRGMGGSNGMAEGDGGDGAAGGGGGLGFDENEGFVAIEPHILASATMADIDGDNHMEVIFPVSYYIDPEHAHHYPKDINPAILQAKIYAQPTVADLDGDGRLEVLVGTALGMVYVIDADSGYPRHGFPIQLHAITTSLVTANLLGGSDLEVIASDLNGNVVVFNAAAEILYDVALPGSIYYTPTLADINGDGILDIVCSVYLEGEGGKGKSVIYVLSGDSGKILYNFFLPAEAIISAPIVLTSLSSRHHDASSSMTSSSKSISSLLTKQQQATSSFSNSNSSMLRGKSMTADEILPSNSQPDRDDGVHMLVTTFEGHLYIVQLPTGPPPPLTKSSTKSRSQKAGSSTTTTSQICLQSIDLGAQSYTPVLVDDVTSDGYLDLITTTLEGDLAIYSTTVPAENDRIWNSMPRHRQASHYLFRSLDLLISYEEKLRWQHPSFINDEDEESPVSLRFTIADSLHSAKSDHGENIPVGRSPYTVTISRSTNDVTTPLFLGHYDRPGDYVAQWPLRELLAAASFGHYGHADLVLVVKVVDSHYTIGEDQLLVHLDLTSRYRWIKYFILAPVLLFASLTFLKIQNL